MQAIPIRPRAALFRCRCRCSAELRYPQRPTGLITAPAARQTRTSLWVLRATARWHLRKSRVLR